ncbi:hypothetical protein PR202_gb01799 [Eleusine coracana subsp. coracana]|uniref:Uncharacterized protein n=1 Tax=Eleusine coracana subsp. coracana TaxID=191504 RepID=A0AAV5DXQ2_ELECO|nr:hypothetical protein PR202_gb01799 [Eleusine coracana subsp. coracana]
MTDPAEPQRQRGARGGNPHPTRKASPSRKAVIARQCRAVLQQRAGKGTEETAASARARGLRSLVSARLLRWCGVVWCASRQAGRRWRRGVGDGAASGRAARPGDKRIKRHCPTSAAFNSCPPATTRRLLANKASGNSSFLALNLPRG